MIPAVNQRLLAGRQEFLGYLRRRLGTLDEAEDALQNFSLKVIRAAQSSGHEEKINAWMGQILRHTLIDHYRRRAVRVCANAAAPSDQMAIAPLCQGSCPPLYFSSISQVGGIGQ